MVAKGSWCDDAFGMVFQSVAGTLQHWEERKDAGGGKSSGVISFFQIKNRLLSFLFSKFISFHESSVRSILLLAFVQ